MPPQIGDIVLYRLPNKYGEERWRPALVTTAWSEDCLNLHVVLDYNDQDEGIDVTPTSCTRGEGVRDWKPKG